MELAMSRQVSTRRKGSIQAANWLSWVSTPWRSALRSVTWGRALGVLCHDVGDSRWQECGWRSVADCSMGSMVVVVDVPDPDGGGALGF